MADPEIICAGMIVVDVLVDGFDGPPPRGETGRVASVSLAPGGDAINEAAALAKLGNRVGLTGLLGDDPRGGLIVAACERLGIDTRGLVREPGRATSTGVVLIEPGGERGFLSPRDGSIFAFGPEHVDLDLIRPARAGDNFVGGLVHGLVRVALLAVEHLMGKLLREPYRTRGRSRLFPRGHAARPTEGRPLSGTDMPSVGGARPRGSRAACWARSPRGRSPIHHRIARQRMRKPPVPSLRRKGGRDGGRIAWAAGRPGFQRPRPIRTIFPPGGRREKTLLPRLRRRERQGILLMGPNG